MTSTPAKVPPHIAIRAYLLLVAKVPVQPKPIDPPRRGPVPVPLPT